MSVVQDSLGLSADDLGMDREDALADLNFDEEGNETDDNDKEDAGDDDTNVRVEPDDDFQQPQEPRQRQVDDLSVTHTQQNPNEFAVKEFKFDGKR